MALQRCPRCGKQKDADLGYYAQPNAASGRMAVCKDCHKKHMADRRRDDPAVRERDRERAKQPHRIEKTKNNSRAWREKNPDAYRAQNAVNNALRDGKIRREPCAICASPENLHAHHKDYGKPLEVVWLCARCHHRLHAIFPELEGANKSAPERAAG